MSREPELESEEMQRIYRYRSLCNEYDWPAIEDMILRNRMYWPSPSSFNDPMDCRPNLVFGYDDISRKKWVKNAVARIMQSKSRVDRRVMVRRMMGEGPEHHRRNAINGFSNWMRESAVCCFSRVPDNMLMWSHYADHHRGVCVIFQEIIEPEPFIAIDVRYSAERPEIDITRLRDEGPTAMRKAIGTKSTDWAYEQEKRMLDYRGQAGIRTFDPSAIRGVILGARISEEDGERIRSLAGERGGEFEIWKCRLSETEFALILDREV